MAGDPDLIPPAPSSNMKLRPVGRVKIAVVTEKEDAVAALVLGLLHLCGPSFHLRKKGEGTGATMRYVIELTDVKGKLSLLVVVLECFSPQEGSTAEHPQRTPTKGPKTVRQRPADIAKMSPIELWHSARQARQLRKTQHKLAETLLKTFRIMEPIDIPQDLALVPANSHLLHVSVASALDNALLKLTAQKSIRKFPKPKMYNRMTRVIRVGVAGAWDDISSWEEGSESSGWGSWASQDEVEGYKVQYHPTTWEEDTYFRGHKKLKRYRSYVETLLRWNCTIDDGSDDEAPGLVEADSFEEHLEESYSNLSLESWDTSQTMGVLQEEVMA